MREPTCEMTPDGSYIFEVQTDDGTRAVAPVFPEDVDEVAGPPSAGTLSPEEKKRRYQVARLIAEPELRRQLGSA